MKLLRARLPEQLLGKDVFEVIHPDYRESIRGRIQRRYATEAPSPARESVLLALDGSRVQIEAAAIPISWNGSPAIEVIARDIRERKRAARRRRGSRMRNGPRDSNRDHG